MHAGVHGGTVRLGHVITQGIPQTLRRQPVGVEFARAGVLPDLFVHQRLRQAGRVLLVVTQLAEADDVDHHVLAELHAVFERQLRGQHHGLRIVAIDVQYRRLDAFDDVGAIQRGSQVTRVGGGEADLVVDDQVHRAAGGVTAGLRQRQGFLVHALPGKCRIAVHQHRQNLAAAGVTAAIHAGAHRTFDHRVDDFQVRRIERQRQVNGAARRGHVGTETLVVLHVTSGQVLGSGVVELGKQITGHLAQGVDEHVQATPVGHADDDLLNAFGARLLDQLVDCGDEALAAFQRKALLPDKLGVQEALKPFGGGQPVENVLLPFG